MTPQPPIEPTSTKQAHSIVKHRRRLVLLFQLICIFIYRWTFTQHQQCTWPALHISRAPEKHDNDWCLHLNYDNYNISCLSSTGTAPSTLFRNEFSRNIRVAPRHGTERLMVSVQRKERIFFRCKKLEASEFVANAKSFEFGESRVGHSAVNGVALFVHPMDSRAVTSLTIQFGILLHKPRSHFDISYNIFQIPKVSKTIGE